MSSVPHTSSPSPARLGDATRLGPVHLTVTDLDRSIAWYRDVLGLTVRRRVRGSAALGTAADELVALEELPEARPAGRHAGLYHFALLFPTREELARAALRVAAARSPIQGASDHGTHEAIYLPDPDGNGIELAADRPRDQWPDISSPEGYGGGPAPLDLDDLLGTVGDAPVPAVAADGLVVGHVHLHVADLDAATRFYRDGLGFDVMTDLGSAVFVSAGGYHHHVGYNLWRGGGIPPAPADAVGLRHWTLVTGSPEELATVRERLAELGIPARAHDGGLVATDPAGIPVHLVSATPAG